MNNNLQRYVCYVCNARTINVRNMVRIIEDENNIAKNDLIISRRDAFGLPPIPIRQQTRLCLNCNRTIIDELREIENDPTCLRLNVFRQTINTTCAFCNNGHNLTRLSMKCRVNIFVIVNIYVPESVRVCQHHLDENGLIIRQLLAGLEFINRPYKIKGAQLAPFLQELRICSQTEKWQFCDIDSFSDTEFQTLSPISKDQFRDLYTYCDNILRDNQQRFVTKKNLLTFLCKMKQGLSDNFLKIIFNYPTRQCVSMVISNTRLSLMQRFVPNNIGFQAITRQEFITRHVTPFANMLYNPNPERPVAIAYIDGTYCEIPKSKNFQVPTYLSMFKFSKA